VCAVVGVATAAAWLVSGWRSFHWAGADWARTAGGGWGSVSLGRGNLDLVLGRSALDRSGSVVRSVALTEDDLRANLAPRSPGPHWAWSRPRVLTASGPGGSVRVVVPLWLVFGAAALGAPLCWPSWGRGRCRTCGYDLAGNRTGTCPECGGTAVARVRACATAWPRAMTAWS
jgi:hypothetical protein